MMVEGVMLEGTDSRSTDEGAVDPDADEIQVAVVHRRFAHYRRPLYDGLLRLHPDIRLTVYCGEDSKDPGGSGISPDGGDPAYLKRVRSFTFRWGAVELLLQPGTVRSLIRRPADVAVFEGRVLLLSSLLLLIWRRLTGRRSIIWLKGWPRAEGEGRISRLMRTGYLALAHHYIVYGEEGRSRLEHYGVSPDRITVAQNTVDVSTLLLPDPPGSERAADPAVQALLDDPRGFLFNIGRLVASKAVADLLEAYALVRSQSDDILPRLVVTGRGPEAERLEAHARRLELGDSVVFTGAVSDADAELLFRSARCCILPGAVGLALNQALAAGRPVICADEPGPDSELLVHERNGLRFPGGDVRALVDSIVRLLEDPDLADRLGERGRLSIRDSATMQNMIARYADALRSAAR